MVDKYITLQTTLSKGNPLGPWKVAKLWDRALSKTQTNPLRVLGHNMPKKRSKANVYESSYLLPIATNRANLKIGHG